MRIESVHPIDSRARKSWQSAQVHVDEVRQGRTVAGFLGEVLGREVAVERVEQTPSEFATQFPADVLWVRLADGTELSLFLKHLGTEEADHPDKAGPEKEVILYRDLLSRGDLPVVRYYGSCWDEETQRQELYLEYVEDWSLKYQPLEEWYTAARSLAHLHAAFADRTEELRACNVLLELDAGYVRSWAERAVREVARHTPALSGRLEKVVSRYDSVVGPLSEAPETLVHNDLSPKNVLADRSESPTRICIIDWECAGIGHGVLDLIHLAYGLDEGPRRRLCDAYFGELAGTFLAPATPRDQTRLIAACEIHKAVHRIAHCGYWDLSAAAVEVLIGHAEPFGDQL